MPETLESRIESVLFSQCSYRITGEDTSPDASLTDDLGLDSLDRIELAFALQDEFGVEISDEEVDSLVHVSDIHTLVRNKLRNPPESES